MNALPGWVLLLAVLVSAAGFQGVGFVARGAAPVTNGTERPAVASPSPTAQGLPDRGPNGWIGPSTGPKDSPDGPVALGGHFSPPHWDSGLDTNGNGLYNFLVVNANISVDTANNYTVDGFLYLSNSSLPLYNATSIHLDPSNQTIPVFFDGPAINSSGVDGPYSVTLQLREDGNVYPLDTNAYTTLAYSHLAFDPEPAVFSPPHSDTGIDTDGDGRINVLDVNASIFVNVAGEYYLNALLHDLNNTIDIFSFLFVRLDPGPRTVELPFSGIVLNASGVDGPYFIDMSLYSTPQPNPLDVSEHITAAYNHLQFEEPAAMGSSYAPVAPTIDGALAADEWTHAHVENLTAIPGNQVPAYLFIMNDDNFLYVAYDATGDTSSNSTDVASIAFDTNHDGRATPGYEDELVQGGWALNNSAHYVFSSSGDWIINESPINPDLPNQRGLSAAWGFGSSPRNGVHHRIYEFKVPLPLLGAHPGDTLGFFGGSHPAPGVYDKATLGWSAWPDWTAGPIPLNAYGNLNLASSGDSFPPTIVVVSPAQGTVSRTDSVIVTWNASDNGSGLDHFELRVDNGPAIRLPANATSYTVTGLADGPHRIEVTAYDVVGNPQAARVSFTVDMIAPSVRIDAPSGNFVGTSSVAVSWTAADVGSGLAEVDVSLDGGTPSVLPGTARSDTLSPVSDGPHTIRVTVIDAAGNTASAAVSVTIDTALPAITITAPESGRVIPSADTTISFTSGDVGSGIDRIEIVVDSGSAARLGATDTSYAVKGLSPGDHRVDVTVYDRAGNSRTVTVTFRVDTSFFSLSGPYGYAGIGVVAASLVGIVVAAVAIARRRRDRARPPPSSP
jgi:Big-like domain-containing protein